FSQPAGGQRQCAGVHAFGRSRIAEHQSRDLYSTVQFQSRLWILRLRPTPESGFWLGCRIGKERSVAVADARLATLRVLGIPLGISLLDLVYRQRVLLAFRYLALQPREPNQRIAECVSTDAAAGTGRRVFAESESFPR